MRALYTITNETAQVRYVGNGVTKTFSVPFQFFEPDTLRVRLVTGDTSSTLTYGLDYEVSGGAGGTGAVTIATLASPATTIVIDLAMPVTQETIDLSPNGPLPAEDVEQGFDRIVTLVKQLRQDLRSVPQMVPSFNPDSSPVPFLPRPIASNMLIGNAGATGWENITPAGVAQLVAALYPVENPTQGTIFVNPAGDAATDTVAMQNACALASSTGLMVQLGSGTFVVRVPETVSWYYNNNGTSISGEDTYPVHVCIPISSNLHVKGRGRNTRIMVEGFTAAPGTEPRIFLFGTAAHTTAQNVTNNVVFEEMMFDFTATYGVFPGFTYAHGLVGVSDFRRSNIVYYSDNSPKRGRGLFAENCRRRISHNLTYHNIVQGYFTHFEYDTIEMGIYSNGVTEFYDMDESAFNWLGVGFEIQNSINNDEVFDFASPNNLVLSNVVATNVGRLYHQYTKWPGSWPTYAEYFRNAKMPVVSVDIATSTITWPSGIDLAADRPVAFEETSGSLPTGVALDTMYYIVGSSISGASAQISTTPGGAAIVMSGVQSGTHRARLYPFTPNKCKNVVVDNVVGRSMRDGSFSTVMISSTRVAFYRLVEPGVQSENITLRNWKLAGGTRIEINEGSVLLDDVVMDDPQPGMGPPPPASPDPLVSAAIYAVQSTTNAPAIANSQLDLVMRDVVIRRSLGAGGRVSGAKTLKIRGFKVEQYNTRADATTNIGLAVSNLGLKANSRYDIDGLDIVTTVTNCQDLNLNDYVTPNSYTFSSGNDVRLRTASSGSTNILSDLNGGLSNVAATINLPVLNTTSSTVHDDVVLHSHDAHYYVLGMRVVNHDAITGDAGNNSRLRLMKSVAGSKTNLISLGAIDEVSQTADTTRTAYIADPTVAAAILAPGEILVTSVDTNNGTGSTAIPKLRVAVSAIKFYKT